MFLNSVYFLLFSEYTSENTIDLEDPNIEEIQAIFPYDTVYAPNYGYNTKEALKLPETSADGSAEKPTQTAIQFPSATSKFVRFLGHFWALIGPWLAILSWHVCPSFGEFGNLGTPFCVLAAPILTVTFLRYEFSSFGSASGPSATGTGTGSGSMTTMRPGGSRICPPGTPNARPGQMCIGNRPIPGSG